MLWCIVMTLVGILLSVSSVNGWFIVPDFCVYICFIIAAVLLCLSIINYFIIRRQAKKIQDRFDKFSGGHSRWF